MSALNDNSSTKRVPFMDRSHNPIIQRVSKEQYLARNAVQYSSEQSNSVQEIQISISQTHSFLTISILEFARQSEQFRIREFRDVGEG